MVSKDDGEGEGAREEGDFHLGTTLMLARQLCVGR